MRLSWLIVTALAMPMALAAQTPAPPVATLSLSEALHQAKNNNPLYLQRLNNAATARWQVRNAYGQLLPSASVSGGIDYTGSGQANFGQGFTRQTSAIMGSSYNAGFSCSLTVRGCWHQSSRRRISAPSMRKLSVRRAASGSR